MILMLPLNPYRLIGDTFHLLAILTLLFKLIKTKSCADVSGKAQILFSLVYITRYMDLFVYFVSLYNESMKILYICASLTTLCLIFVTFRHTYDRIHDSFRIELLLIPVAVLAYYINYDLTPMEVLWAFSIYLEAVAIVPQLYLICKTGRPTTITCVYLVMLTLYRGFYICNWAWRYKMEGHFDLISVSGGAVQTFIMICTLIVTETSKPRQENQNVNAGSERSEQSLEVDESGVFIIKMSAQPQDPVKKPAFTYKI